MVDFELLWLFNIEPSPITHVLINSCITKNLNLKFLYFFICSLSELRTWLKSLQDNLSYILVILWMRYIYKKILEVIGWFHSLAYHNNGMSVVLERLRKNKCLDPITLESEFFKSISFFLQLFTSLRGRSIKPNIPISICGSAPGYFWKIENFSYGYINMYMVYTVAPQRLVNCIPTLTSNVQYHAVFLYVKSSLLLQARQCMPLSIWFTVYFCPYFSCMSHRLPCMIFFTASLRAFCCQTDQWAQGV